MIATEISIYLFAKKKKDKSIKINFFKNKLKETNMLPVFALIALEKIINTALKTDPITQAGLAAVGQSYAVNHA